MKSIFLGFVSALWCALFTSSSIAADKVLQLGESVSIGEHRITMPRLHPRSKTEGPLYPSSALRRGEQGIVWLKVLIDESGKRKTTEIVISSGYPDLDKGAIDQIKQWRFLFGEIDGTPIEMSLILQTVFRKQGADQKAVIEQMAKSTKEAAKLSDENLRSILKSISP